MATRQQAIQFQRDLEKLDDNQIKEKYSDQLIDELIPFLEQIEQQGQTRTGTGSAGFLDRAKAGRQTSISNRVSMRLWIPIRIV